MQVFLILTKCSEYRAKGEVRPIMPNNNSVKDSSNDFFLYHGLSIRNYRLPFACSAIQQSNMQAFQFNACCYTHGIVANHVCVCVCVSVCLLNHIIIMQKPLNYE